MKRELYKLSWFGLLFFVSISFNAFTQSDHAKKKPHTSQDCAGNCFSAEVLTALKISEGCTEYEMRVSHNGSCRYDLSHFVVEIPCGEVSNVSNSGGWAQVVGKDPTTGLTGLKIDGVGNFGKSFPDFFTVKFTWCNNSSCNSPSDCWQPHVAFKAATCVDYDTVSFSCGSNSLKASVEKQNASCSGNADGSLSAHVEGGEAPYTYNWSTGCTTSSVENLPTGTYTVTIIDVNGVEVTLTEEITGPSITLSASPVNPTCSGSNDGMIDLQVSGGQEPYAYVWSNGATSQDLSTLGSGNYQVMVTDSTGCPNEAIFQLTAPAISITAQITQPACTQSNGQINIAVSGGTEPYTFTWNNNATTEDLANISAGTYQVTVTDAKGCIKQASYFLKENNTLHIGFAVTPTTCPDTGSGAINITVTGGTAPYSYLWANGSTSEDLTGLSTGLQKITVTDANGCTVMSNISVFRKTFQVASQVTAPTCSGETNGSISLTPNGVPPYTYVWSTGQTTSTINNLPDGLYTVTVTDGTGCSQVLNYFISDPAITTSSSVGNLQCGAQGAFSIDLSVTGGVSPYSYEWSNGETTEDLSGLNSGSYDVNITDANGCSESVNVVVNPVVVTWACLIDPPGKSPVCGSVGNALSTSVMDADSYAWSVQSDDDQWVISSGQTSPLILFTAGGGVAPATFTLAITKGGCTQICDYTFNSCSSVMTCGPENAASAAPASLTAETPGANFQLAVYPNPVVDQLHFGWTAEADEHVQLELVDMRGKPIAKLYSGFVREGESYLVEWPAADVKDGLFFYHYSSGTRTLRGKLLKP